ncbi:hypothetical protein EN02_025510 [Vibrio parahaemolyticus]|nr:hypothetical protein EN02_025510 [Vibrio parahaemolyticus]
MLNFDVLKERHRNERGQYSQSLSTRVHRALSWLKKAESCDDDYSKFSSTKWSQAYCFEKRDRYCNSTR